VRSGYQHVSSTRKQVRSTETQRQRRVSKSISRFPARRRTISHTVSTSALAKRKRQRACHLPWRFETLSLAGFAAPALHQPPSPAVISGFGVVAQSQTKQPGSWQAANPCQYEVSPAS